MSEEANIAHILELTRLDAESFDPYARKPEDFVPDGNVYNLTYEEYIRDFFRSSDPLDPDNLFKTFTDYYPSYPLEKPNLYFEKSPIFGKTFQLDKYSDDFLKKLFDDVYVIPADTKTYCVYSFTDKDGQRQYRTFTPRTF